MSEPLLRIESLSVGFPLRKGLSQVLHEVGFEIRRGTTTCVVGESGSGKSVTARAILNMVPRPGSILGGRVLFDPDGTGAEDLARLDPKGRRIRRIRGGRISMIFQEPLSSLSPVHTIGNQIVEAVRLHRDVNRREARRIAAEALEQVEIPNPAESLDRYPFEYSGGMRQRAMIAMALSSHPDLLIADEPTTALDVTTQAEILDLIASLQRRLNMAVMFITHDMGVVAEIADDVVVMERGRVVERGGVEEIFRSPTQDYTRRLLGAVRRLETRAKRPARPPEDPEEVLRVEELRKHFVSGGGLFGKAARAVKAVDGVSFSLREGEALGIVGESGSGKTTVGRCILRAIEPTSGKVWYRDADILAASPPALRAVRRQVRMIFQDPYASLNPRMTVKQIVAEPMLVNADRSLGDVGERVAELLSAVGLDPDMMERYPHAFSGGQRQRIVVARAIALTPRIVIADEPTSALDVSIRIQILDLLLRLQSEMGLGFVFISHDISVIRYFCDRVAVMYRGRIVEIGDTERVITDPRHPYTKALLSSVPVTDPSLRGTRTRHRYDPEAA